MGLLTRAVEAAQDGTIRKERERRAAFRDELALIQKGCRHSLVIEAPAHAMRYGPHLEPIRICASCGLEEHSQSLFGRYTELGNREGRDVEEADRNYVYGLRPPQ